MRNHSLRIQINSVFSSFCNFYKKKQLVSMATVAQIFRFHLFLRSTSPKVLLCKAAKLLLPAHVFQTKLLQYFNFLLFIFGSKCGKSTFGKWGPKSAQISPSRTTLPTIVLTFTHTYRKWTVPPLFSPAQPPPSPDTVVLTLTIIS